MYHTGTLLLWALCGKPYRYLVLVTGLRSAGTWYLPGTSAGEYHLTQGLVYHRVRVLVTGLHC